MKKHFLLRICCLVLVLALTTSIVSAASNTSMQTALPITFDKNYSGAITSTDTKLYYQFSLPSSGRVTLTATTYLNCYLYIYDANGIELWDYECSPNSTTGRCDLTQPIDLTQGTYYLCVSHRWGSTGNYNFSLSFTSANESFAETQDGSNNDIATANAIAIGKTYHGQIAKNDGKDFYKFSLSSSGELTLTATTYMACELRIYDANGKELWKYECSPNSTTGRCDLTQSIDLTQGTYYLCISKDYWGNTGNYDFSLSFTSANESFAETQDGSNNDIATANAIIIGKTYHGQIAKNDTKDFYKFSLSSSGKLTLTATTYMDCYLNLYDVNGKGIWDYRCRLNSTTGRCEFTQPIDLSQGTYYLCVSQYSNRTGNYNFRLTSDAESHVHSYTNAVTAPTCTEKGYTTHTCECGDSYVDTYVNALGHAWDEGKVTTKPTETAEGVKIYTCTRCGETKTETIPSLNHTHKYSTTVTPPICTEKGYTTHTCACGDSYVDTYVDALGHDFKDGVCTRCGEKAPVQAFPDVKESAWYYDAVMYATSHGIFKGNTDGTFGPSNPMNRAMLVTTLHRLAGEPAPKAAAAFSDVDAARYYAKPVAWAAENGIVNGMGDNKFQPNTNVTREQAATFLYRYAAYAQLDTTARADLSKFHDAGKVSNFAKDSLSWANAEGLINGKKNTQTGVISLDPKGSATRAELAKILMSFMENVVK